MLEKKEEASLFELCNILFIVLTHYYDQSQHAKSVSYENKSSDHPRMLVNRQACKLYDQSLALLDSLSRRQKQCLYYLVRGKSMRDIGVKLGISMRTVETHINEVKSKFFCFNRCEIIEKCIDSGIYQYLDGEIGKKFISE